MEVNNRKSPSQHDSNQNVERLSANADLSFDLTTPSQQYQKQLHQESDYIKTALTNPQVASGNNLSSWQTRSPRNFLENVKEELDEQKMNNSFYAKNPKNFVKGNRKLPNVQQLKKKQSSDKQSYQIKQKSPIKELQIVDVDSTRAKESANTNRFHIHSAQHETMHQNEIEAAPIDTKCQKDNNGKLLNVAKVNMEFDGMMQHTNGIMGFSSGGFQKMDIKIKSQKRNDRVNPLVYLIKKREEYCEGDDFTTQQDNEIMEYNRIPVARMSQKGSKRGSMTHAPSSPKHNHNRRIISLLNITQQESPTDLLKHEFETPNRLQVYISQRSNEQVTQQSLPQNINLMLEDSTCTSSKQRQQQVQMLFPLEAPRDNSLPKTQRQKQNLPNNHFDQQKSVRTRAQTNNYKNQKYLSFYQQKINLEKRFKGKMSRGGPYQPSPKNIEYQPGKGGEAYQAIPQRIKSPLEYYENLSRSDSKEERDTKGKTKEQKQQQFCIAILPPLKSREISPRYNIAFKNQTRQRQRTPIKLNERSLQMLKDQEALKTFINKRLFNEGTLNFTMPSSPLDQSLMNPFNFTKDVAGKYTRKRRSSSTYEQNLQDIQNQISSKLTKGVYPMAGVDFTINQALHSLIAQKHKNDNHKHNEELEALLKNIDLKGQKLNFTQKGKQQLK